MDDTLKRAAHEAGYDLVRRDRQVRLETHLQALLPHLGVDVVIDVGANTGQYAQRLRALGFAGRIVSYEPLSALREPLEQTAADDPDWIVRPVALGAAPGTATLRMSPDTSWSSLKGFTDYGKRRFPSQDRDAMPETVDVVRLDADLPTLVADLDAPRLFLKLDTQGFDLEVFAGAAGIMDMIAGLQAEVAFLSIYADTPRFAEAIARYEQSGFAVTGLFPVKRDKETLRMIEMDCVMRRATKVDG